MNTKAEKGETHLFIHRFPLKLKTEIKIAAARAHRTMKSVIAEACEQWLSRKKGK